MVLPLRIATASPRAIARGHGVGRGGQLEPLAGDHQQPLVDIVDRVVADHGLRIALDRDVALGVDPIDFGVAVGARALGFAVVRDQRVGMHLARSAGGDCIAARDVEMLVLLPFDAGIRLDLDRLAVIGLAGQLRQRRRRRQPGEQQGQPEPGHAGQPRQPSPVPHDHGFFLVATGFAAAVLPAGCCAAAAGACLWALAAGLP
jgi:hypothetical protein